jgi:hypothetical protein
MYVMICTRLDVSYTPSVTIIYQSNPIERHLTIVNNILKYLKSLKMSSQSIYGGEEELAVKGYINSSFQADLDDSRSQSGYVFILNGGAMS